MKKTLLIILVAALMVSAVSIAAFAKGNMQGPGQGAGKGYQCIANDTLKLTEAQQQKMLKIRQDFQKETLDLRFEMQKKNLELRNLWNTKPLNQAAIEAKAKEVTGLRVQMANKAEAMYEKMKAVLTSEQLKIYESRFNGGPGFGGSKQGCGQGCGMRMMGPGFKS